MPVIRGGDGGEGRYFLDCQGCFCFPRAAKQAQSRAGSRACASSCSPWGLPVPRCPSTVDPGLGRVAGPVSLRWLLGTGGLWAPSAAPRFAIAALVTCAFWGPLCFKEEFVAGNSSQSSSASVHTCGSRGQSCLLLASAALLRLLWYDRVTGPSTCHLSGPLPTCWRGLEASGGG